GFGVEDADGAVGTTAGQQACVGGEGQGRSHLTCAFGEEEDLSAAAGPDLPELDPAGPRQGLAPPCSSLEFLPMAQEGEPPARGKRRRVASLDGRHPEWACQWTVSYNAGQKGPVHPLPESNPAIGRKGQ